MEARKVRPTLADTLFLHFNGGYGDEAHYRLAPGVQCLSLHSTYSFCIS